jgi:hypothetical protein
MADPVAYRVAAFDAEDERIDEIVVPAGIENLTRKSLIQEGAARVTIEPANADELPEQGELD